MEGNGRREDRVDGGGGEKEKGERESERSRSLYFVVSYCFRMFFSKLA